MRYRFFCILCFLFQFSAEARDLPTVPFHGAAIPVPIGIESARFSSLLDELWGMESIRAIVVYGSRTHFTSGYLPMVDSDLDLAVYFDTHPLHSLEEHYALEGRLIEVIGRRIDLRSYDSFEWEVRDAFSGFPVHEASELPDLPSPRTECATRLTANKAKGFGRESLIIYRPHARYPTIGQTLADKGYVNAFAIVD